MPEDLNRKTHPTVHEVVTGDRRLPIHRERRTLLSPLRDAIIRMGDRRLLMDLFDPTRSPKVPDAGTTLVLHETGLPPLLRFRLATGHEFQIAMRQQGPVVPFTAGRPASGGWLWTPECDLRGLRDVVLTDSRFFVELLKGPAR